MRNIINDSRDPRFTAFRRDLQDLYDKHVTRGGLDPVAAAGAMVDLGCHNLVSTTDINSIADAMLRDLVREHQAATAPRPELAEAN